LTLIVRDSGRPSDWRHTGKPSLELGTGVERGPGLSLRELIFLLGRNWLWLVLALGTGLGIGASLILPERYAAEGLLVIDTREINIPEFQSVRSSRTVEPWGGRSEARVLDSRAMVATVIEKLDLLHDPSYNPTLSDPPLYAWLAAQSWLPQEWRDELTPKPEFGGAIEKLRHTIGAQLGLAAE
jgi:uncharacterized protein involved in exopolysaccharide biosynthesis